nr:SLC2A4 regulator [Loxodonta africana]
MPLRLGVQGGWLSRPPALSPPRPQGPAVSDGFAGLELALPLEPRAADLWGPGSWVGAAPGPQSAHIPVPAQRAPPGRARLDEVMAAAALTSLSTSPLLLGTPAAAFSSESGLEPWKEALGRPPGSYSSSSNSNSGDWDLASDPSSPSTPSPPLPPEAAHFLFGEPAQRKRKNSAQVMFQCLWKSCGKVLSSASGMQRHIRVVHLVPPGGPRSGPASRQPFPPSSSANPRYVCVQGPGRGRVGRSPALQCPIPFLVPPRKPRGDAKKCRKVYGMDRRELWCTACRWKKACQRFLD